MRTSSVKYPSNESSIKSLDKLGAISIMKNHDKTESYIFHPEIINSWNVRF